MAQVGDTITYTYSDGSSVAEDVSNVDEVVVEYCDGAGGETSDNSTAGGSGGRTEGVVADVSSQSTIYIWVASSQQEGRYDGEAGSVDFDTFLRSGDGGGSTEISVLNTDQSDSADEPFIVASGGGGGGSVDVQGGSGARESGLAEGIAPPLGGSTVGSSPGGDGEATVGDGTGVPIVDSGTTIKGGGSSADADGEVKLSFQSGLEPPDPPSNLTAEQQ